MSNQQLFFLCAVIMFSVPSWRGPMAERTTWADVAMNFVFLIPTCLLIWSLRK
jgi:hypothetical protein